MFKFGWSLCLFSILVPFCSGSDTLTEGQSLLPNQTLISEEGKFELGFFSQPNTSERYIGIWYKNIPIQTVVWVANRANPIPNANLSSVRLELIDGQLCILYSNSQVIWAAAISNATEAAILDSGNFVLRNVSGTIWQSFDHPTDTWLPGGRLGYSKISDAEARLVSWKNPFDPAPGVFSLGMDRNGAEIYVMGNRAQQWRSGVWQDGQFASLPMQTTFNFTYVSRDDWTYFMYNNYVDDGSIVYRFQLGYDGLIRVWVWLANQLEWGLFLTAPSDYCQRYNFCRANAVCNIAYNISFVPMCGCLDGFVPKSPLAWSSADFSNGCVRRDTLQCSRGSAQFRTAPVIRLPANAVSLQVGMSDICEFACSVNCSCNAYAYSNKGGCLMYMGDLLDLQSLPNSSSASDLNVRMSSGRASSSRQGNRHVLPWALSLAVSAAMLVCIFCSCYLWRKSKRKELMRAHQNLLLLDLNLNGPSNEAHNTARGVREEEKNHEYELPTFSFGSIVAATNNFSVSNKLGQGGFGPVYKGELLNGQFVAVKRLSETSGQGLEEFKNETELFAKLQHRNLVGILGCCIEQDEKILVYEYMPNKSLDSFLFDPNKLELSDWGKRIEIIEGIAQGLLYLHQYSRFRIVHRDLKASNILLDGDMNPKIADFGMARIFGGDKLQANTNRIVGTYGYMSPEYAMEGLFSIKSDVFAFGVLLLEILSGKKNTGFYGSDHLSLLGYAWNLWENDRAVELVDSRLKIPPSSNSAPLKYIHVGLLCVQESPGLRPTMMDVITMLNGEQAALASPRHPAFTVGRIAVNSSSGDREVEILSVNCSTVSVVEAR